jgi:outer membrane protein assembly factor BamB
MPRYTPILLLLLAAWPAQTEDWTRFRGRDARGIATGTGFPVELGPGKNMVWRTPVRSGKSSPILTGKHVFLTSFEDGKLYTECFDRATGRRIWEQSVERKYFDFANLLNHPAAISPVTDGENVYSFFKDFGLVSYDAEGRLRWQAPLGQLVNTMGLGASPVIAGNHVVVVADQLHNSYVAAYDRRNGELRWKTAREESEAWGSPLVFEPGGDTPPQVLTVARGLYGAYDAVSGERTATLRGLSTTIVASPILDGDTLYAFGYGSDSPAPFAERLARLDKNKDGQLTEDEIGNEAFIRGIAKFTGNRDMIVTEDEWNLKQKEVMGPNSLFALKIAPNGEARELWRYEKGFNGIIPSPLLLDGVLYVIRNGGILTSFDAVTGKVIKAGRVEGAIAGYSSSPVSAEGRIYVASEDGHVAVLRAAPGGQWEVTRVNDLDEPIFATPALSEGQIFLRTGSALYRFGAAAPE